jgi:FkbH-like protein
LRNYTIEPIEPFLKYHVLRAGIRPTLTYGGYGTITQELLADDSPLRREMPELIILSLMLDVLDPGFGSAGWTASEAMDEIDNLLSLALEHTCGLIAINTFFAPFYSMQGIATATSYPNTDTEVAKLNRYLREVVEKHASRLVLIDWERLLRLLGQEASIDYRFWRMSQAPFKSQFLDLYAKEISKAVKALKGKAKKCVVLDCDNTLWGGVVGEDGVDGLALDRHTWPGSAYYDFQRSLIGLHGRGVMLALCSKNNEADVWDVLDRHLHCLIKRQHLVAWRINWENKASNLMALADELNIGLDAIVFVDDNPAEIELITQCCPDVTALQVPHPLYEYPTLLLKDGHFDTLAFSKEDRQRAQMYQQERTRVREKERFANIHDYLQSLHMVAYIFPGEALDYPRMAQLTQKTNQFNLTTQRYSEPAIAALVQQSDAVVFGLSVEDRFGAMGLTGVFIARHQDGLGLIDTMLLSCRILGRDLELAFADTCMTTLEKRWSIDRWEASYIPTKKNQQVACFWEKLGFEMVQEEQGRKRYATRVQPRPSPYEAFISIVKERPT